MLIKKACKAWKQWMSLSFLESRLLLEQPLRTTSTVTIIEKHWVCFLKEYNEHAKPSQKMQFLLEQIVNIDQKMKSN